MSYKQLVKSPTKTVKKTVFAAATLSLLHRKPSRNINASKESVACITF